MIIFSHKTAYPKVEKKIVKEDPIIEEETQEEIISDEMNDEISFEESKLLPSIEREKKYKK